MEICLAESFGKLLLEACKAKFNYQLSGGNTQSRSCSQLYKRLPWSPSHGEASTCRVWTWWGLQAEPELCRWCTSCITAL